MFEATEPDEGVLLSALLEGVNKVSFLEVCVVILLDLTTRQEWVGTLSPG